MGKALLVKKSNLIWSKPLGLWLENPWFSNDDGQRDQEMLHRTDDTVPPTTVTWNHQKRENCYAWATIRIWKIKNYSKKKNLETTWISKDINKLLIILSELM